MSEVMCECGHHRHDHRTIKYDLRITSTAMDSPVEDVEVQGINTVTHCKERCMCRAFRTR
jgi:hypothetical protein